jgi:hypothetical protein
MQLSELLGDHVRDANRNLVGTVVDVRLAVGGDFDDFPPTPAVFGLIVSPRTTSSYLGYERSEARKPAVLSAALRWRHRGTFLVLWADVARIDVESVTLRKDFVRYSPILRDDR